MKRTLVAAALLCVTAPVYGQPPSTSPSAAGSTTARAPSASASAAPSSAPKTSPSADPHAGLPPGHPAPNAASGDTAMQGPTPDQVAPAPELPAGTIALQLVDGDNRAMPGATAILDIDRNTVAEGESHEERTLEVDGSGTARFDGLKLGSGLTYRVRTRRGEAEFASPSFSLKEESGVRVLLHAHEPVDSLKEAMVVMEAFVVLEVKQDTVRVNHLLRIYNLGRTALVAKDLALTLPAGARAFSQEQSGGSVTLRERGGEVAFEGTIAPGQMELMYGYTLPLESGPTLTLALPMPPRILQAQVSVNAGPGMTLSVGGFSPAQMNRRRDGKRVLQAVKQLDPTRSPVEFLEQVENGRLDVTVSGLPASGSGPLVAAGLAVLALALGVLGARRNSSTEGRGELAEELAEARDTLLEELASLERAKATGEVGPKSYEKLRNALLDALARVLSRIDGGGAAA